MRLNWEADGNSALNELEEAQEFVENASWESKIGFVRDAQHYYMFDSPDGLEWMVEQLISWGYETESENLKLSYSIRQSTTVVDTLSTYAYLEWSSKE